LWLVSLLLIFFSNAFLALRVTNIVTAIVASRPTPYNTHSRGRALAMPGADIDQRTEIDIHHRAGHHADPGSQHIVTQPDAREAKTA